MVRDTPPYGHAPTYQISLTYLERQKCSGPDKKILFKKHLFDLKVKGQGPTKVIMVCDIPPYGHAPTYQIFENVQVATDRMQRVNVCMRDGESLPFHFNI